MRAGCRKDETRDRRTAEELQPGQHLGHYVIVEKIAMGGMGTVFKALEPSLERYVAIKVLRPEFAQDEEYLTYFEQEARAVAALRHPNIVPIYYIGVEGQIAYFSMAYIDGANLDMWVEAGRLIDSSEALWFLPQAVSALQHAADTDIIHLDIKPGNFLVDSSNTIMLTDFGLARKLNERVKSSDDRTAFGTPQFVSPEQILREGTDLRTDIYSLGVTTFYLMCGQTPFDGETAEDIVWGHLEKPFPEEILVESRISEGWIEVIRKMMARDPNERFQTYAELQEVLADVDNFRATSTTRVALENPTPMVIPRVGNDPANLHGLLTEKSADWRTNASQKTQTSLNREMVLENMIERMPDLSITPMAHTLRDLCSSAPGDHNDVFEAFDKIPGYYEAAAQIAQFMASAMGEELETAEDVVEVLGLVRARGLALLFLSIRFECKPSTSFDWRPLWQHQIAVGMLIDLMYDALDIRRSGMEFAVGAAHDMGKMLFGDMYPYAYLTCLDDAIKTERPLAEIERETFGLDHAELFGHWASENKVPATLTSIISGHEPDLGRPPKGRDTLLSLALISANHLCKQLGIGYSGNPRLPVLTWAQLPATKTLWEKRWHRDYPYEDFTEGFIEHFAQFPEVL